MTQRAAIDLHRNELEAVEEKLNEVKVPQCVTSGPFHDDVAPHLSHLVGEHNYVGKHKLKLIPELNRLIDVVLQTLVVCIGLPGLGPPCTVHRDP